MRGAFAVAAMITDNQCYQLAQNLHLQHIAIERKQIDDFSSLMTISTKAGADRRLPVSVGYH